MSGCWAASWSGALLSPLQTQPVLFPQWDSHLTCFFGIQGPRPAGLSLMGGSESCFKLGTLVLVSLRGFCLVTVATTL